MAGVRSGRARALVSALGGLAAAACTATLPASDYFDGSGVETVGLVDNVEALALAGETLYATDGARVLAFDARGPARATEGEEIARGAQRVRGLVAEPGGLVAWCDGTEGGAFFRAPGRGPVRLADSSRCDAVAVSAGKVTVAAAEAFGVTLRRTVVATGASDLDLALPTGPQATTPLLATAADGVLFVATSAGVARECLAGDVGCERGLCRVSAASVEDVSSLHASLAGTSARPVLVTGLAATLVAPTTTCCPSTARSCATDALRSQRGVSVGAAFAVYEGALYTLRQGGVFRVESFVDAEKDRFLAAAPSSARRLALDEARFFFQDSRKIQRAPFLASR